MDIDKVMGSAEGREGSVVVTSIFETRFGSKLILILFWNLSELVEPKVLDPGTPPPITAVLHILDSNDQPLGKAAIGDTLHLVVTSEQAGGDLI